MGIQNISLINPTIKSAGQIVQKNATTATPLNKQNIDTVELSSKTNIKQKNTSFEEIEKSFVLPSFDKKIFKQGNKIIEGVTLGKGINGVAKLPDGSFFTGEMITQDKLGRKVVSRYNSGLVEMKKILSSDNKEIAKKFIFREKGGWTRTITTKSSNPEKCFIKEMRFHQNGTLRYMRYGENPIGSVHAENGKFVCYNNKGRLIFNGHCIAKASCLVNFFDRNGNLYRKLEVFSNPNDDEEILSCNEYSYKNGKVVKKISAYILEDSLDKFALNLHKRSSFDEGIKYVAFPQKFNNAKIFPKYTNGTGFDVEKQNDCSINVRLSTFKREEPYALEISAFSVDENLFSSKKSWFIPLDGNEYFIQREKPLEDPMLIDVLKELREIAEEIKKTNSFSLKCGSYNVADEINKALN